MQYLTKIRVRYAETDQMRRAYHANYLIWFEAARINMMRENGISYAELENKGYYLPVIQAHLNYRFPALFDEILFIDSRITDMPKAKISISYQVTNETSRIITDGYTLHSFMNEKGKPVRPPESFRRILAKKLTEGEDAG